MNDQMNTDFRMYAKRQIKDAIRELEPFSGDKGENQRFSFPVLSILADEAVMPGIRALGRSGKADDVQVSQARLDWLKAIAEQVEYEIKNFAQPNLDSRVEQLRDHVREFQFPVETGGKGAVWNGTPYYGERVDDIVQAILTVYS